MNKIAVYLTLVGFLASFTGSRSKGHLEKVHHRDVLETVEVLRDFRDRFPRERRGKSFSLAAQFRTDLKHGNCEDVRGVTQMNERIYVLCADIEDALKVFNVGAVFKEEGDIKIRTPTGTGYTTDLAACHKTGEIYIVFKKNQEGDGSVWKINVKTLEVSEWVRHVNVYSGLISMTSDCTLVLTGRTNIQVINQQKQWTVIPLPDYLWDSVQTMALKNGKFLVVKDYIREVDQQGTHLRTFREFPGLQGMQDKIGVAEYLAFDNKNSDVFVADSLYDRVVAVDQGFRESRVLLDGESEGFTSPGRLSYDSNTGILVVAKIFRPTYIKIYKLK